MSIGPSISKEDRERARKQQREDQRQQQDEQTARNLAQNAAGQGAFAAPGYWDMLGDPDIDDPAWGDEIEAFLKTESSRARALGNITRSEWEDLRLRLENEFFHIQNEMHGPDTQLADDDMRLLYGEERPDLTDAKARRMRGSREAIEMLTSLSVDSKGLDSGTEIHAVARTESDEPDEDGSGGMFGRLGSYMAR